MIDAERRYTYEQAINRYCLYLDEKNWSGIVDLFSTDMELDFSDLLGEPARRVSSRSYIDFVAAVFDPLVTMHTLHNSIMFEDGGRHYLRNRLVACHRTVEPEPRQFDLIGSYVVGFDPADHDGRIAELRLHVAWGDGAAGVVDPSTDRAQAAIAAMWQSTGAGH